MNKLAVLALAGFAVAGTLAGCSDSVTRETTYHRTTSSSIEDPFDLDDEREVTTRRTRIQRTYED